MYSTTKRRVLVSLRVYDGPDLPFVKEDQIVFCVNDAKELGTSYCDFLSCVGNLVEMQLACLDLEHDYKVDEDALDYGTYEECDDHMHDNDGDPLIVVTLPICRTPFIECAQCGFAPFTRDIETSYFAIPLNEDVWDEWLCPEH